MVAVTPLLASILKLQPPGQARGEGRRLERLPLSRSSPIDDKGRGGGRAGQKEGQGRRREVRSDIEAGEGMILTD
jgi:hypothetical protein